MAAPRKPGKDSQLRESLKNTPESREDARHGLGGESVDIDTTKELSGFTVRLTVGQKQRLERMLWERHGEKLAPGVRRIITEWMNRQ